MVTSSPRKIGRPRRNQIDVLRTRVWFSYLRRASGLKPAEIQAVVEPTSQGDSGDGIDRRRKYAAYAAGRRVPQRQRGKVYAVEAAEAIYPGTGKVFESPMWAVLNGYRPCLEEAIAALTRMDETTQNVVLDRDPSGGLRLARFDDERARAFSALRSFDSLAASLVLAAVPGALPTGLARAVDEVLFSVGSIEAFAGFSSEMSIVLSDWYASISAPYTWRLQIPLGRAIAWSPPRGLVVEFDGRPLSLKACLAAEKKASMAQQAAATDSSRLDRDEP